MPNTPAVTYIIPSYNHCPYVEQAILSVMNQDYDDIELIVLDDGSTDGSRELLQKLSSKLGFIYGEHPNMGCAATLHKGFKMARGKYVCTLASDDWIPPEKTSVQVAYMEANPHIAACGGNMVIVNNHGNLLKIPKNKQFRTLDFEDVFYKKKHILPAPTAMIRKDVYFEVGGYDPDIRIEDTYLWLKITKKGHLIAVLDAALAYYRQHDSNIQKNHEFMMAELEKIYSHYKSEAGYSYIINKWRSRYALAAAKAGNKTYARELLKKIPLRRYNKKTLRALFHIYVPR